MNHELFFTAWPIVSSWLRDQYIKAINQRRLRNLRLAVFNAWVEEARVFPPPLVSSSGSDYDYNVTGPDSESESDDDYVELIPPPRHLHGHNAVMTMWHNAQSST